VQWEGIILGVLQWKKGWEISDWLLPVHPSGSDTEYKCQHDS